MSNFSALNTALSGLQAHQQALELTGANIANVNTPGYTRRRVDLQPAGGTAIRSRYSDTIQWSTLGVTVAGVIRARDGFLDVKARTEMANSASATTLSNVLSGVEGTFPEPSDTGIASQLSGLWNAFDDAANKPGSIPARTAVLAQATSLVQSLNKASTDLTDIRNNLSTSLSATITEVNSMAKQVADLNDQIRSGSVSGAEVGDLQDRRDVLIDKLTSSVGATARPGEANTVDVILGGTALVSGIHAEQLTAVSVGPLSPPLDTLPIQKTELRWASDGYPVNGYGGTIGATIQGMNDIVPRYMSDLNTVASTLVTQVNTLHATGQGQNPVTDVNLNFFDPAGVTAATISISSDVANQPSKLALGSVGSGALDNTIARALGALANSPTGADALHRSMVGRLGVETQTATSRADLQEKFATQSQAERTSADGVNLDEEMTNLVMSQRSYEASARLLTTVDSMLDQLINRTGLVGR